VRETEDEWTSLMRLAISGDSAAYHRLLRALTPVLRAGARRGLARAGQPVDQSEDIVQDILLAVHLKRHTWDTNAPFAPWLFAIARNKLIDALRRRGRRAVGAALDAHRRLGALVDQVRRLRQQIRGAQTHFGILEAVKQVRIHRLANLACRTALWTTARRPREAVPVNGYARW